MIPNDCSDLRAEVDRAERRRRRSRSPSRARSSTRAAYAARKGWTVADEHVYVDDGISGAEFANRPGFLRLMNALKPRPPFQVLDHVRGITARTRGDRDGVRAEAARDRPASACSSTSRTASARSTPPPTRSCCRSRRSPTSSSARRRGSGRTTRWCGRRAPGTSPAAACSATTTSRSLDADGERSHVERRINEAEAAVVRRIFELCAEGAGLTRIAKQLNAERAPAPRAQQGRPQAGRRRPCARCSAGRSTAARSSGTRRASGTVGPASTSTPGRQAEWMRTAGARSCGSSATDLWAAHARMRGSRASHGKARGGRRAAVATATSRYLLRALRGVRLCGGGLTCA